MNTKKKILITVIIITFCFINGCAGAGDYNFDLVNGYKFIRACGGCEKIIPPADICPRSTLECAKIREEMSIPAAVVELAWNDRYIIVKQYQLKNRNSYKGDTYQVPDKTKVSYWILDTEENHRYGPFDLEEFNEQLEVFKLTELELKPPLYHERKIIKANKNAKS